MKNNKGFTLIELLAVIVILGIIMVIAVPAVTKYIDNSKKDSFVSSAKMYVDAVQAKVANGEITIPDGETEKLYINNIELQKGGKSPYGGEYDPLKSYVGVTNNGDNYSYSVVLVDTKGNCIPKTSVKDLKNSSVTSSCNEVVGITTKKDVVLNINTDRQTIMDTKIYGNTVEGTKVGSDGTIDLVVSGKNLFNGQRIVNHCSSITSCEYGYNQNNGVFTVKQNDGRSWSLVHIDIVGLKIGKNYSIYVYNDGLVPVIFTSSTLPATLKADGTYDLTYWLLSGTVPAKSEISNTFIMKNANYSDIFKFYKSDLANTDFPYDTKVQIEVGTSKTTFEPYKENRYVLELKDTNGNVIYGLGTGEIIEKKNGKWGINNGTTFTELIGSTQSKLNNIKLYDGISNIFLDESIQPSNIEIKYYQ